MGKAVFSGLSEIQDRDLCPTAEIPAIHFFYRSFQIEHTDCYLIDHMDFSGNPVISIVPIKFHFQYKNLDVIGFIDIKRVLC